MTVVTMYKVLYEFVLVMKQKIDENLDKGGWRDERPEDLFMGLQQEVAELFEEVVKGKRDTQAIVRECADVANFAMMIADKVQHERQSKANDTKG